jgi:hypothetical protein
MVRNKIIAAKIEAAADGTDANANGSDLPAARQMVPN